jgi:hypothetical protein
VERLELGEHRLLAEPVDRQGAVAALPDALVLRAGLDSDVLGEDLLLALDGAPTGRDPLVGARTGDAIGLHRLAPPSCLTHSLTRSQISGHQAALFRSAGRSPERLVRGGRSWPRLCGEAGNGGPII